jgi:hypothetical protein
MTRELEWNWSVSGLASVPPGRAAKRDGPEEPWERFPHQYPDL